MDKQYNLTELIDCINPAELDYQQWLSVGMGLKESGYTASDWDRWSQRDHTRYHAGECFRKWDSFHGGGSAPVTGGTIVQMARERGWTPPRPEEHEIEWDDVIGGGKDDLVVVDKAWIEAREVTEPDSWDPAGQITRYLETLFEASENVGYVNESYKKEGRYLPAKGYYDRTAGELIQLLNDCGGDIQKVFGDYKEEAGAWIRFNPLDGNGVKNENVTEFRYALVESDSMDVDRQNAIIRELELPVACLVHSGGKSLHAIVKVEAKDYDEYRKRVDYLYEVCRKNGLQVDGQNKNPSRLSRMPGVVRNGKKQFLADTNIGKENWKQWQAWIESVNDDLPEPESLTSVWDCLPDLSPPLIDGILRQGHKMLLSGSSKAGKSFSLIELCIAIAEGRKWLDWQCTKGRVLYVNLELDRASCLHRFKNVYQALGWPASHLDNIDIWNLRGKTVPMDKLAPKLIRRALKKNYIAVIIDPIYKVITGDENSADQMAHFCNQFDLVCHELGAAVIYCHHHSKGGQGAKRSMDRASGSGVFARDPDALLDLIELELSEDIIKQQENKTACQVCENALRRYIKDWEDEVDLDDRCSEKAFTEACRRLLSSEQFKALELALDGVKEALKGLTGWRVEGTLREFPKFQPVNLWFDYPVHYVDREGILQDVDPDGEKPPWQKNFAKKKTPQERKKEREEAVETAYEACSIDEQVTIESMAEYMGVTEKTVRNRIKEHGGFWVDEGNVGKK